MIQLQRRGNFKLAEPSAAAPVKTGASLPIPANEKLGSAVVGWGGGDAPATPAAVPIEINYSPLIDND